MSTAQPATATSSAHPAPALLQRVAAMIYEGVLLFGVAVGTGAVFFALTGGVADVSAARRLALQIVLFVAIGAYFVYCWTHSGQTLAMRTWHLRVVGADGRAPRPARAVLRYLLAWHLFAPGLAFIALFGPGLPAAGAALLIGMAAMLVVGHAGAGHQLLHDRWLGTRVIRT